MILHIGGDAVVPAQHIVAILDVETLCSEEAESYIEACKEEGRYVEVEKTNSKSLIIVQSKTGEKAYASPISAATLHKRLNIAGVQDIKYEGLVNT